MKEIDDDRESRSLRRDDNLYPSSGDSDEDDSEAGSSGEGSDRARELNTPSLRCLELLSHFLLAPCYFRCSLERPHSCTVVTRRAGGKAGGAASDPSTRTMQEGGVQRWANRGCGSLPTRCAQCLVLSAQSARSRGSWIRRGNESHRACYGSPRQAALPTGGRRTFRFSCVCSFPPCVRDDMFPPSSSDEEEEEEEQEEEESSGDDTGERVEGRENVSSAAAAAGAEGGDGSGGAKGGGTSAAAGAGSGAVADRLERSLQVSDGD